MIDNLVQGWLWNCVYSQKAQQLKDEIKAKNGTVEKLPTGALIKLTGLNGKIDTYKLKEKLIEDCAWSVAFIQHENESPDAYVRLQTKDSAKEVNIPDGTLSIRILSAISQCADLFS